MNDRQYLPRKAKGKAVYGGLIIVMVLGGFLLQASWMQRVRDKDAADIVPQGLAAKISRWMMQKKGLNPDTVSNEAPGIERIGCLNCIGTGSVLSDAGRREMCPFCLGVGYHVIRRYDATDRICPACSGLGRVRLPDTDEVGLCPRCGGRGLIRSQAAIDAAADGN